MREKESISERPNPIERQSNFFIHKAFALVAENNLVEKLDIINEQEVAYLVSTLAWDISRKTEGKFIDNIFGFDYKNPMMSYFEHKSGVLGWMVKKIEKESELEKQTTARLAYIKETLSLINQPVINTFNSIDRASNLLSTIYIQADKKTLSSEIFNGSEDIIIKFRDEIREIKNKSRVNL